MNKWNHIEEPVVEQTTGAMGGQRVTHPAFGQISGSRCQGHVNLYGSDFTHHNFISIKVAHSSFDRHLSRDWPHAGKEITELWLSEAQWATFVSSLNTGGGVQCTLRHINSEALPLLPTPKPKIDQFNTEAHESIERATIALQELTASIADLSLSNKTKAILHSKVNSAQAAIGSSVKFILKQFGEHMETTVEKAKIEIEAYINSSVNRAGIKALVNEQKPIQFLEEDE